MSKPTITAEAMALARDHLFASDEQFMLSLSEALARLHSTATNADRIEALNRTTAEHVKRVDDAALAQARAEAATVERARIASILRAPEAEGRRKAAEALAFDGDTPADAAIAALKGLPRDTTPSATPPQALTPEIEAALKARDEGRGLLTANGEYATIATDPTPPKAADPAKAAWSRVIAQINAEGGANAKAAAG
jgi:hypothetical protein